MNECRTSTTRMRCGGLLLGDSMEQAYELLTNQGGKNYSILDGSYERFCFPTNDHHGEVLLRLICDEELDNEHVSCRSLIWSPNSRVKRWRTTP